MSVSGRKWNMISVIVPVYNAGHYLDRCIASILYQNYSDIELILIDDGSEDNSLTICKKYEVKDRRVHVIHTDNHGGAAARNIGIQFAHGEYIAFADADDFVDPEIYVLLLKGLKKYKADIAECDYEQIFSDMTVSTKLYNGKWTEYDSQAVMENHIRDQLFRQIIWNKLYTRQVISDIKFVEGKTIDDEFWTYRVLGNAKKAVHVSCVLYYYVQHTESVMHHQYSIKRLQGLEAQQMRLDYIKNKFPDLYTLAENRLYFSCMYHMQMSLRYLRNEEKERAKAKIKEILGKSFKDCKYIRSLTGKQKIWALLSQINFDGTCRIRNCLNIGL